MSTARIDQGLFVESIKNIKRANIQIDSDSDK